MPSDSEPNTPAGDATAVSSGLFGRLRDVWERRARSIGLAYVWLGLAAASITVAATNGAALFVVIGGAALFLALVRLGRVIRRDHEHDDASARRARWVSRSVLTAALVVFVGTSRLVTGIADELEFLALVTGFALISSLINELRFSHWPGPWRGPATLVATLILVLGALWFTPADSSAVALGLLVIAIMVGHLGIVLASEDRIDQLADDVATRALSWPVTIAGLSMLVVGFALIRGTGLTVGYSAAVIVGFVVVVATAASKGDGDLFAIIAAFTLVWAAAPRTVPAPESTVDQPGPAVLIVGDSFISGEGANRFIAGTNERDGNTCRRAASSWAVRIAEASDAVPDNVIFRACSGSKAPAVDTDDQLADLEGRDIDMVLVSVGGNDAGFTRIGQACLAPGDCSHVAEALRDRLDLGKAPPSIEQMRIPVEEAIVAAYQRIRSAVGPDAVIVAVPYPRAIQLPGCAATLLATNEHRFIDSFTGELNAVIRSAAAREGIVVLDPIEDALIEPDLQLCDDDTVSERGINFIEASPMTGSIADTLNPTNWINNSLHPNERGHDAMLAAATAWFDENPDLVNSSAVTGDRHEVAAISELTGGEPTCAEPADAELDCTDADDPNRWLLRQSVLLGRVVWWRIAIVVAGAWLASVPAIAAAHRREWTTGRLLDWIRDRLRGSVGGD